MRNGILNGISNRVDTLITIHYKITFIRVKIYAMLAIQRQTRTICFLVTSTRSTRVINQRANEYGGFQSIRRIREKNGFVDRIALVIPRITNETVFWNLDAIHACLATLLLEKCRIKARHRNFVSVFSPCKRSTKGNIQCKCKFCVLLFYNREKFTIKISISYKRNWDFSIPYNLVICLNVILKVSENALYINEKSIV